MQRFTFGLASGESKGSKWLNATQAYSASWVDRLTQRVRGLPFPAVLFYVGLWAIMVALQTTVKWRDGTYPVGVLYLPHVLLAGLAIWQLAAIHFLDDLAGRVVADFRPLLDVDDGQYEWIRYRLTTMPSRNVRLLTTTAFVLHIALLTVEAMVVPALFRSLKVYTSLPAAAVDHTLSFAFWLLWILFIYHTIRQLRLVSRLYTQYTRVNLFQPGPLYALSRLTAGSALAILLMGYAFYAALPVQAMGRIGSPVTWTMNTWGLVGTMLVAVVAFIWPLLGIHGLMVKEKERLMAEAGRHLEAAMVELHRRADSNELEGMDMLSSLLASLAFEQKMLGEISTWPWQPATLRVFTTAVLSPLALYLIQQVLVAFFGP